MKKDILYLLAPGFISGGKREYCPECAEVWGLLSYFPAIRESVEIFYQPLAHPRSGLVERLGAGEWNCPTLILEDGAGYQAHDFVKSRQGAHFIDNARDIGNYFADRYGTPFPRGG